MSNTTGGTRRNTPCRCGCGFATGQRNGYVRGHTPVRRPAVPCNHSAERRALVNVLRPLARRTDVSFTPVRTISLHGSEIHIGVDEGSYDTKPICGALAARDTETTDTPANCSSCAALIRAIGLGYLLRDEQGYTDLYRPRRRH